MQILPDPNETSGSESVQNTGIRILNPALGISKLTYTTLNKYMNIHTLYLYYTYTYSYKKWTQYMGLPVQCIVIIYILQPSMGGGGAERPPLFLGFSLYSKISLGNPYLKSLYLAKLFVADAPMKEKKQFHPLPEHFEIWVRGLWLLHVATLTENFTK